MAPRPAAAEWPGDPSLNVPVCTLPSYQLEPQIAPDGAGGAILVWLDRRLACGDVCVDLYAQRVSAAGAVQWTTDGMPLCTAIGEQWSGIVVPDGAGGAIAAWADYRHDPGSYTYSEIYLQRVSASGAVQWAPNGVPLCATTVDKEHEPALIPDGTGGAIVAWRDSRSGAQDIYVQRVAADGATRWTANGVALCTAAGSQSGPAIVPDGEGGAVVTWTDSRSGNDDIYAQRVSADGGVLWTGNGVAVCAAAGSQARPVVSPDSLGGAIVSWAEYRGGSYGVYAQRIAGDGTIRWTADGVALRTAASSTYQPAVRIASDGAGGAIVAWEDSRGGTHAYDIYAQRVSGDGAVQWTAGGVGLCTAPGAQGGPAIIPDGSGGAVVAWQDSRGADADIYAQRVSATGLMTWPADGVALSTAARGQHGVRIAPDGAGGAIAAWMDDRSGTGDIYAQAITGGGELGSIVDVPEDVPLSFALEPVRPNPARGGALTVRFTLAGPAAASLELLDVAGRRLVTRVVGSLGAGRHTADLGLGQALAPGLYWVRLRQGTDSRLTRVAVLR